jgi:hypothetical protein
MVSEIQHGEQITAETFLDKNPTHKLVQKLSSGAFGRTIPTIEDFSTQPDVVEFLRELLRYFTIDGNEDEDEALRKCHHHGWIHADLTEDGRTCYAFPSPLHLVCVSWMLPVPEQHVQVSPRSAYLLIQALQPRSLEEHEDD